ncbi:hypothetical protein N8T08_000601 [Aspergillus melleus]|uniref:Uncharacterized protein n=1 Tax=Aspergillus melleus TaxID=138277 RepID=A0ACC3APT8_9EURO|nr:hypothetical protein N8T08_000601 [Aspergillus melleus]
MGGPTATTTATTSFPDLLDVIVVGAGPCGLAVAARLNEETPSAMFTDEEHQRYHWINKHRGRMALVRSHHRKMKGVKAEKWQGFDARRAGQSQNPPSSSSLSSVIGEAEIDERDRKDYFSPSTGLFSDYCSSIVSRYGLDDPGMISQCEVEDLKYDIHPELSPSDKIFTVTTTDGRQLYSRAVVLAIGPGRTKIFPFKMTKEEEHGACHSTEIRTFPSPNVRQKIQQRQQTNLVVVGGGLSSAQIVDMAIRKGVSKVWLLMRSDFKVKHFDISLSWMGKFRNYEKAAFWSADTDEERMEMIKAARNGGSITPRYTKILKQHAARHRVSIHPRTVISGREFCTASQTWRLTTDPPIPDLPRIDYIYFATGMQADVTELPLLQRMNREYPIESKQGLPCITEDLMWKADVPLFLTGRLAALRLGPGGPNLEGARLGAERVAWGMEEVLGRKESEEKNETERSKECFCGLGNRYAELGEVSW